MRITDECIVKNLPYAKKTKDRMTGEASYEFVLSRCDENASDPVSDYVNAIVADHAIPSPVPDYMLNTISDSIAKAFADNTEKLDQDHIKIYPLAVIDSKDIGMSYCDGSSSSKKPAAGFASVTLYDPNESDSPMIESFSGLPKCYNAFSGSIKGGTNNVGELTAIGSCVKNSDAHTIQIIASDSAYAIGAFREWIDNWKSNGYRGYSGSKITNADLIKSVESMIDGRKGDVFLFRWIKGHDEDSFNEICDRLAKDAIGVK